jgi:hypothetical protein
MHAVWKFERATIVLWIVLRAVVTREDEPVTTRFITETIINTVDHASPD